jgi:hypothetical protein
MNNLIDRIETMEEEKLKELERGLCRDSLKFLCGTSLQMNDWDKVHDDVEDFAITNRDARYKMYLIPRGHLKTSILSIGKTIQDILKDFNQTVLLTSAVWGNSRSFLSEIKEYLTSKSRLPYLFGNFVSDKWNQDEIVIKQRTMANKTPTIDTAGIDKVLTSQHYKTIRADDLVTRENITNREQMQKVINHFKDLVKLLEPEGHLEIIGTRWHDADLYGHVLKELSSADLKGDAFVSMSRKAIENGEVIFKKKFTSEGLDNIKKQIGSYEYACNYDNSPVNPDTQQFKPPIRYWNVIDEGAVHYGAFDPATSEDKNSCDAVVIDACITPSNQLCVAEYKAFGGGSKNPADMMDCIFKYVSMFKIKKFGIETNGGQAVYIKLLQEEQKKRNIFFEIVPINQHRDKFSRIMALQPRYESGNLLLKQGMMELEEQLIRFPVSEKLDIIDGLSMIMQIAEPKLIYKPKVYIPQGDRHAA